MQGFDDRYLLDVEPQQGCSRVEPVDVTVGTPCMWLAYLPSRPDESPLGVPRVSSYALAVP